MPELGETTDPRALVPGDPQALRSWAQGWREFGSAVDTAHQDVHGADPGPWQGEARQAYTGYLRTTTPNWTGGSDAYRGAADAVHRYADTLEWAHGATTTVVDDHQRATTPEDKAAAATELQRIRSQVGNAGDDAARALAGANPKPPAPQVSTLVAPAAGPGPGPGRYSGWDDVPSQHPDPGKISASSRKAHILWGDQWGGGHHRNSRRPGKTVFPEGWDDKKIMDTVEDVAKNPDSPPRQQDDGSWVAEGRRDGVRVEVIIEPDGKVRTAYPTDGPGVAVNDENGDPQPINPEDADDTDGHEEEVDPEEERQEADEEDEDAVWERHRAEEERRRAEDAEEAGDEETAAEESDAARESEAGANASEMAADVHRRRAEQAEDADTYMVELPW